MATLAEVLALGTAQLSEHTCAASAAQQEALELLTTALGVTREQATVRMQEEVSETSLAQYHDFLRRRIAHEPLAYIVGHAPFHGHDFAVGPGVLIPRDATEFIVDTAIAIARDCNKPFTFVDVGTGSGSIAISLALAFPQMPVIAIERSIEALRYGIENKTRLRGFSVMFRDGDLLERFAIPEHAIIVANLPYIPTNDIPGLSPDIVEYEPHSALDGGLDGMDYYRAMLTQLAAEGLRASWVAVIVEFFPNQYETFASIVRYTIGDEHYVVTPIKNTNDVIVGASVTLRAQTE